MNVLEKIIFASLAFAGAVNLPESAQAKTAPVEVEAGAKKYFYTDNNGKAGMIINHANGRREVFTSRDGLTWQRVKGPVPQVKVQSTVKLATTPAKPASTVPTKISYTVTPATAAEREETRIAAREAARLAFDFEFAGL